MNIGITLVRNSVPMIAYYKNKLKEHGCDETYVYYCDAFYEPFTIDDLEFVKALTSGDTVTTVELTTLCNSVETFEQLLRMFQRRNIHFKVMDHNFDFSPEDLTDSVIEELIGYFESEYQQYGFIVDEQLVDFGRYRFTPTEVEEISELLEQQSLTSLAQETEIPKTTLETFLSLYKEHQLYAS